MQCQTVRKDQECYLMSKKGCTYNNGICCEVVEKCGGCNRRVEFNSTWFCTASPEPETKWRNGNCNLATHLEAEVEKEKVKINPLKASKRQGR